MELNNCKGGLTIEGGPEFKIESTNIGLFVSGDFSVKFSLKLGGGPNLENENLGRLDCGFLESFSSASSEGAGGGGPKRENEYLIRRGAAGGGNRV